MAEHNVNNDNTKNDTIGFNQSTNNSSSHLNKFQRNVIVDLEEEIKAIGSLCNKCNENADNEIMKNNENSSNRILPNIETMNDLLKWYSVKENELLENEDDKFKRFLNFLNDEKQTSSNLLHQVNQSLSNITELLNEYQQVSYKTNSVHEASENLLENQSKLINTKENICEKLVHYKSLDKLRHSLDNFTFSIHNPNMESILEEIDGHINHHRSHKHWKESWTYEARFNQVLRKILSLITENIINCITHTAQQVSTSQASHYARFQAAAYSIAPLIKLLESKSATSSEYENALNECQQCYVRERETSIAPVVQKQIYDIVAKGGSDHCALMRTACTYLIHTSQDEHNLYHQFFHIQNKIFDKYLESLCMTLYDTTRPIVIHMKHLESLTELCSILRLEVLQEQVYNNDEALGPFGVVVEQLLQDAQERLLFRAHKYVQTDIAEYNPSPGDLAYPEKLHLMQSIAQSLHEKEFQNLARSESRCSINSNISTTSSEVPKMNNLNQWSSPADIHGMWYPPVRRTLICLSRLYRCVERPTFQGISQEALKCCMQSVIKAAEQISSKKSVLDGEMFQIKHLLILREQIAPFQVDFTVKEMSLDFTKTKTAAFQLYNKRTRLFSLNSNNALLEFLLEGSPEVKEQWLDSRKDVDRILKTSCESFIKNAARYLTGDLMLVIDKAELWIDKETLKEQPWATSKNLCEHVKLAMKSIKSNLPNLQTTMQLYLANKDTEFILYRTIKNNVINCFTRMQQILISNNYTEEEQIEIGCPTAEQASVILSSAFLSNV